MSTVLRLVALRPPTKCHAAINHVKNFYDDQLVASVNVQIKFQSIYKNTKS